MRFEKENELMMENFLKEDGAYRSDHNAPGGTASIVMTTSENPLKINTIPNLMIELQKYLKTMDIPELRKNDINWLERNLSVRNSNHPNFIRTMVILKNILSK